MEECLKIFGFNNVNHLIYGYKINVISLHKEEMLLGRRLYQVDKDKVKPNIPIITFDELVETKRALDRGYQQIYE